MSQQVTASHLKRDAYLYVRQSTMRQVRENTESTERQYALRAKAVGLGWPPERIVVVDSDLGQSGASAADREGFQRLVAEVGLGHVGIVLGLEVSRLARSSSDWYRLLEICAMTDTLLLDEDGIYNPGDFNDRLVLGLKGTMSEAELHVLRARLRGGLLNKARRGDLKTPLPAGFVYAPDGRVVLDPDQQVQNAVRLLFQAFRRTGSAGQTVREFRRRGIAFPRCTRGAPRNGELVWVPLTHGIVVDVLHNPRYAGAFCFGRQRVRRIPGRGLHVERLSREQWVACRPGAHPGYISWEEYEENLRRLAANAPAVHSGAPREGTALLAGLALCGRCGARLAVRYHARSGGRLVPDYYCARTLASSGTRCQYIPGAGLDEAIGNLLIESVTPLALEAALGVQQELVERAEEAERLRRHEVERARYEVELARRRYLQVDPDNRLVADVLETDWNAKLRALQSAEETYERRRSEDRLVVDERCRGKILSLATDFPRLWCDPQTTDRDRKRIVRLILEDVTLLRGDEITAHVRFKGGACRTLRLPLPLPGWRLPKIQPQLIQLIDQLLDEHTDGEVAAELNARHQRGYGGKPFTRRGIWALRQAHHLPDRFTRLRARGLLTLDEIAAAVGVTGHTALKWRRAGLLVGHVYNDRGE